MTRMKLSLWIAVGALSGRLQGGAPFEIDVPAHLLWCTTDTMHLSDQGSGQQGPDLMNKLAGTLADEARAQKLATIGLPFVAAFAKTAGVDPPNDFDVTSCAAVPPDVPTPGGKVTARMEPHRKGLAQICDNAALSACAAALDAAIKAPPWALDQAALGAAARREHTALTGDESADNAVRSLLSTNDLLLGGPATKDSLAAMNTGKVVLAILVELQEPPAK